MVLITLGGMVIFKAQFDKSNSVEAREEYTEYDRYYAMITSDDRADFWQAVYNGARKEGMGENAYVEFLQEIWEPGIPWRNGWRSPLLQMWTES